MSSRCRSERSREEPRGLHLVPLIALLLTGACNADDGGANGSRLLPAASTTATRGDSSPVPLVVSSDLRAGAERPMAALTNPYVDDPVALQVGRDLYAQMNCAGCHGPAGGGGIGPPLADAQWIYGGAPENIVQAILEGRPNGMPSFGGRLPASEAWKIATYVRELSKGAATGAQSSATLDATTGAGARARP